MTGRSAVTGRGVGATAACQAGSVHDRIRQSYDTVAGAYHEHLGNELSYKPLDRALLAALVEQAEPGTPVADIGCGPGHVAGWLAGHGVRAVGIDLSPRMIEVAAAHYPDTEFRTGDLLSLPATDGEFGAAAVLYSIIHLEPDELAPALAELRRVIRPDGRMLVSFHAGDETRHVEELHGHRVDLDFRFLDPAAVAGLVGEAGFALEAQLERAPYPEEVATRRAYLLARRLG